MGWSPEQLAAHLNAFAVTRKIRFTVSAKAPYHWLAGACPRDPTPGTVAALLTEATGQAVSVGDLGWDRSNRALTVVRADDGLEDLWCPGQTLIGLQRVVGSEMVPERRKVLMISGMALTAAAHRWMVDVDRLEFVAGGRRVDRAIVDDLDQIVAAKRRVDDALGGGVMYRSVRAELAFVIDLLVDSTYSEAVGRRLHGIAAELARLAGWACFDSGNDAQAQRYFLVALRAAHQSGDRALGAHILGFMGVQSTLSGRPGDAITLLNSGHEHAASTLTATEKAALFGRLARAHGRDGNVRAADACADSAFEHLARSEPANDPDWIYWCDDADLSGMVGEGYVALGQHARAAKYLQRAVDGLAVSRPRDRVIWITSLACAHLAAGRREPALAEARSGAEIASGLNSDRVVGYLGDFRRRLGRATKDPAVADFDEYLKASFPPRLHPVLQVA